MKKWFVLPLCLTLVGLVFLALWVVNYSKCISKQQAVQIATDYMQANNLAPKGVELNVKESSLDLDLMSLESGQQEWILWLAPADGYGSWIYMSAHTGEVYKAEPGFKEWVYPTDVPNARNYVSFLPVGLYIITIVLSAFFWRKRVFQVVFWIFLGLTIIMRLIYPVLALLYTFFFIMS